MIAKLSSTIPIARQPFRNSKHPQHLSLFSLMALKNNSPEWEFFVQEGFFFRLLYCERFHSMTCLKTGYVSSHPTQPQVTIWRMPASPIPKWYLQNLHFQQGSSCLSTWPRCHVIFYWKPNTIFLIIGDPFCANGPKSINERYVL